MGRGKVRLDLSVVDDGRGVARSNDLVDVSGSH